MELSLFSKYEVFTPNNKKVHTRNELLKQFEEEINKERPCTYKDKNGKTKKLGKVTGKAIAIKVGHLSEFDLTFFLSECRDYKNRNGSFSKRFFGSLKTGEKLA
jgi:hypothetical protein